MVSPPAAPKLQPMAAAAPSAASAAGTLATTTPAATPAIAATAGPQATPELAPPGIFYLLTATSVTTRDGVLGFPPGTRLKLARPGVYLTLSPAVEVSLRADQVTNDMTAARRVMTSDQKAQATIQNRVAGDVRQVAAGSSTGARTTHSPFGAKDAVGSVTQPSFDPPATPSKPFSSSLDTKTSGLNMTHHSTKDRVGIDSMGNRYWVDIWGRVHYRFRTTD